VHLFDVPSLKEKIHELDEQSLGPNFWDNQREASKIIDKRNGMQFKVDSFTKLNGVFKDLNDFIDSLDINDQEMIDMASADFEKFNVELQDLRHLVLFNGEYDNSGCTIDVHPGAGGTEACDWANMLLRMYERFCEQNDFKYSVLNYEPGEEAGLKSATVLIEGKNAYGMLKGEKGVHRLVRISPFDSNARRHTSFASVNVVPQFDEAVNIQIDP
jgi:peptide chain release factor 2